MKFVVDASEQLKDWLRKTRTVSDSQCGERSRGPEKYECTLPTGHGGDHVAHMATGRAIAIWNTTFEVT